MKTWTLADHGQMVQQLKEGTISAEGIRQGYREWMASKATVVAEISKMTVKELKGVVARFTPYASELKKAELVEKYWEARCDQFTSPSKLDLTVSIGLSDMRIPGRVQEIKDARRQQSLDAITDADIAAFAASCQARMAARNKALTDPQDRDEYIAFLSIRGFDALTDAQVVHWDELCYAHEAARIAAALERSALIEQVELADVEMTVEKSTHTQKQCDIWIVRLSERVERDKYTQLSDAATRLGGHWSTWSKGFLFWTEEDANTFAGIKDDDVSVSERRERVQRWREEKASDRLAQYAMRHDQKAIEALTRERLANTVRRARMAAGAEEDARKEQAMAATIISVAGALEDGCEGILRGIRYASDIVALSYLVSRVQREYATKQNIRYWMDEPLPEVDNAVLRTTVYPYPRMSRNEAEILLGKAKGKRGQSTNIVAVKSALDSDGDVRCKNIEQADALIELMSATGYDGAYGAWGVSTYKVLRRMGISTLPILRHALRSILPHIVTPNAPDPLLVAERDLIGWKAPGYFPTPHAVVDRMIEHACISAGEKVLEPSAGDGNIVERVFDLVEGASVDAVEVQTRLVKVLLMKNQHKWQGRATIISSNFLEMEPMAHYDKVLMNPPFEDGQDACHVQHAYQMLAPGGCLVAIVSPGLFYRQDTVSQAFREWFCERGGVLIEELPAGTFDESGTGVAARMIQIGA